MSRIFAISIILLFNLQAQSQSLSFEELLNLYHQGSGRAIDDSTANKFFEFSPNEQWHQIKTGKILLKTDNFIALTAESDCGAGGYCESSNLSTFTVKGKFIDRAAFESAYGDCVFSMERENIFVSDTLLIFTDLDYEVAECDGEEEEVIKNELQLEYVFISQGKFQRPIIRKINTKRKYYVGSTKFLNRSDLREFSKEELPKIRNEIFASHGYTFSTPKWQQYFSEQEWYKPIDKNVEEFLSIIERHNIKFLLEAEKE